ncbi:MAG TPA: DNA-3-methyladenine glycosylase I [bacterium]|nr:DNA-3-methyladenine glycosylase I [bacterium]
MSADTITAKPVRRCPWPADNELMIRYHDSEWGVPLHDDRKLFEFLVLDAFQAGLSWAIVLKKREGFRRAFANFDPRKVARFDSRKVQQLLADCDIIRNRMKIEATIANARAFLAVRQEYGSFDRYIWQFTGSKTKKNRWRAIGRIPCRSRESDAMSKDLKARGFRFVGSTICYAFMQAAGMVNDHLVGCFRHSEVQGAGSEGGGRR